MDAKHRCQNDKNKVLLINFESWAAKDVTNYIYTFPTHKYANGGNILDIEPLKIVCNLKQRRVVLSNNKSLFKSLSYTSTFYNGIEDTERREMWLSVKAIHGMFHCWESNRGPLAL